MFCVFGIFFVVFDFVAGKNTVYFEKGKPCTFYFCDIFEQLRTARFKKCSLFLQANMHHTDMLPLSGNTIFSQNATAY
jgi:hypothetical protein